MSAPREPRYNDVARHFEAEALPPLLARWLPAGPLALADVGCGDGPWFAALARAGALSASKPSYAVDLEATRLARATASFSFIRPVRAAADSMPQIEDESLDFLISTMVMEHVDDERRYLDELRRVLRPGGRAYITTVFKRRWAWYFRRRDGRTVLDRSHVREYTDLEAFSALILDDARFSRMLALELVPLRFAVLDPLLFLVADHLTPEACRVLRAPRVTIPGYFSLECVVER